MAGSIKGLTLEIGGDTTALTTALGGVNKTSKDLQAELKQVERLLKLDPTNTELLAQKQKILSESVGNTSKKLDTLREAEKQVQEQFKQGKVSEEQYRALQREVIKAEQDLNKLEEQGKKTNNVLSQDDAVNNLKNIGVAAGVAAAAVGAAFLGMANAALENADELQRQADVTGLTAERLQELQYIGNNLGVDLDTMTGAQAKLTKSMAAATDETKGTGEAFAKLGVKVRDSDGNLRDSKTVMQEALEALNKVGNETERDATSMEIFGKSAMEMNPLIKASKDDLNALAKEARDSGAVMSNEAVAGLDAFGDTVDNLKNSILGAFGTKFAEILPQVQEFLNQLKELPGWIQENATKLEIIGVVLGTVTALIIAFNIQQALMAAEMTIWTAIAGVATGVTTSLGVAIAFLTSPIGLVILAIGAIIAIGVLLYKNWDEVIAKASQLGTQIKAKFNEILTTIKTIWENIKTSTKEAWNNIINTIKETLSSLISSVPEIGKNIVEGLWNGINNAASWLKDKISGFASSIISGFKDAFGIESPSKLMRDEVGSMIGAGMALGIEDSISKVKDAMQRINSEVSIGTAAGIGVAGSSTSTTTSTTQYTFAPGSIVIPAKDIKEFQSMSDFFNRLPQVARAQGV